jgi:nucleoside-diphosphate-sugar epimerase
MKNKKVLVTGANGFVGSALLEKLVAEGSCAQIIALHRSELAKGMNQRFGDSVQWLKADITVSDLTDVVTNIDIIFHLAAYVSMDESQVECDLMQHINVIGTERLAKACKLAGVQHFIYVSSIAACEAGLVASIDETNGFPTSAYGKSKKNAEDKLQEIAKNSFEVTILRPTALFGENHLGSIYELIKIINKGWFLLMGNGKNYTNFYYIQDFINVLLAVKNDAKSYGQVFIACDTPYPVRDLILDISLLLKRKCRILPVPLFLGYIIAMGCDVVVKLSGKKLPFSRRRFFAMTRDIRYSNLKLSKILQMSSSHTVSEGLQRTIKWYQKMGYI